MAAKQAALFVYWITVYLTISCRQSEHAHKPGFSLKLSSVVMSRISKKRNPHPRFSLLYWNVQTWTEVEHKAVCHKHYSIFAYPSLLDSWDRCAGSATIREGCRPNSLAVLGLELGRSDQYQRALTVAQPWWESWLALGLNNSLELYTSTRIQDRMLACLFSCGAARTPLFTMCKCRTDFWWTYTNDAPN